MPEPLIFPAKSFLFILYTIFFATSWSLMVYSNSYSSSNSDDDEFSSSRNNIVYNIKRFDNRRRGSKWAAFIDFLERHYEFTASLAVQELSDGTGVSPLTVRQYIYFAREMGLVEVRAVVRRGRRRVYIYRSRLYNQGEGR